MDAMLSSDIASTIIDSEVEFAKPKKIHESAFEPCFSTGRIKTGMNLNVGALNSIDN